MPLFVNNGFERLLLFLGHRGGLDFTHAPGRHRSLHAVTVFVMVSAIGKRRLPRGRDLQSIAELHRVRLGATPNENCPEQQGQTDSFHRL